MWFSSKRKRLHQTNLLTLFQRQRGLEVGPASNRNKRAPELRGDVIVQFFCDNCGKGFLSRQGLGGHQASSNKCRQQGERRNKRQRPGPGFVKMKDGHTADCTCAGCVYSRQDCPQGPAPSPTIASPLRVPNWMVALDPSVRAEVEVYLADMVSEIRNRSMSRPQVCGLVQQRYSCNYDEALAALQWKERMNAFRPTDGHAYRGTYLDNPGLALQLIRFSYSCMC